MGDEVGDLMGDEVGDLMGDEVGDVMGDEIGDVMGDDVGLRVGGLIGGLVETAGGWLGLGVIFGLIDSSKEHSLARG